MADGLDNIVKESVLQLAPGVRLKDDETREAKLLLMPECIVKLNHSATEVLELVDGNRTIENIYSELAARYEDETLHKDLAEFLMDALSRGWIELKQ
ncbi:MAG TPA: pyrroloquinoline quinone biosynthesis peptide chaperone PqqD [Candidatus Melainabacteria bacterium]|jgi:pyrroloquinoline quinone biosynthesis protein D|nr:pyrroloquinoline quinone biosynthesis peptide chaperone PqqD [Candidatus Melainabacteria bacterium]HIN66517.1 pyrroloquinoline quinone biosynthesis peptide chaperone PqqD [Candidatus Obscuribacterales bacterium]